MSIGDRLRDRIGDRLTARGGHGTPGSRGYCGLSFDRRRDCPACGTAVEDGD
ncbi:hypothetical protein [Halosimplex pelagicum]|uniref:Uncharacterized protein n=1 Tax=Halosimplex pelagicum TaxID=869886 RepID=A0A7D5P6D0_9EURY|nr:hypothetical protein [Halosimplex pelagicum]QLH80261.1 hypothetical protein HZS54_00865 [Halosimplex pelagicum]